MSRIPQLLLTQGNVSIAVFLFCQGHKVQFHRSSNYTQWFKIIGAQDIFDLLYTNAIKLFVCLFLNEDISYD